MHKQGVVCERTGHYTQALRWYRRGLNLLRDDDSMAEGTSLRSELSLAFAGVRYRQGKYWEMVRWADEAAVSAEVAGDLASLAHAYYLLDLGTFSLGRPEGERYRELALPIYEQLGDDVGLCNVWNNLGIVDYHAGLWPKALNAYTIACDAAERAGDVVGVATGQNNIGEILTDQGRVDEAVPMFRDALRVFGSAGYPAGVAVAMANLGWAEVLAGSVQTGIEHLERAVAEFAAIGASAFVFSTRVRMVEALVVDSRFAEALELSATLMRTLAEEGDDKPKVQLQRARELGAACDRPGRRGDRGDRRCGSASGRCPVRAGVQRTRPGEPCVDRRRSRRCRRPAALGRNHLRRSGCGGPAPHPVVSPTSPRCESGPLASGAMATPFPPLDGSAPKTQQFDEAPEMGIDPAKRYTATMTRRSARS